MTKRIEADFGESTTTYKEAARIHYAHEGGLEKHDLFIADFLAAAHADGKTSETLIRVCDAILEYASSRVPL